ncbi:hypothetical protein HPB48_012524 [Haemaphysalis longicornis]|uniref:Ig-like domain-containing protein n=1 Tax=Haemaphysalis longicornis TaxID=44386 RepID=A0A9J6G7N2_HAELO|nr:hypothetical protein HPB48_012524 [Haemaphysalis longicornis]
MLSPLSRNSPLRTWFSSAKTPWARPPRTTRLNSGAQPSRLVKSVPAQQQQVGYVGSPEYWPFASHAAPSFDPATPRNVTPPLGRTAYLNCIVNNLGYKTVTWFRRKDLHVLTVGLDTYVQDPRFQAIHLERSNDWALQIRYAQLNDQGLLRVSGEGGPPLFAGQGYALTQMPRHSLFFLS